MYCIVPPEFNEKVLAGRELVDIGIREDSFTAWRQHVAVGPGGFIKGPIGPVAVVAFPSIRRLTSSRFPRKSPERSPEVPRRSFRHHVQPKQLPVGLFKVLPVVHIRPSAMILVKMTIQRIATG